jgi:hypothetical protein
MDIKCTANLMHVKIRIDFRPGTTAAPPPPPLTLLNYELAELALGALQRTARVSDSKSRNCENHRCGFKCVEIGLILGNGPINARGELHESKDDADLSISAILS